MTMIGTGIDDELVIEVFEENPESGIRTVVSIEGAGWIECEDNAEDKKDE
jgi:hypothetical protein